MPQDVDQVHVNATDIDNEEPPAKHRRTGTDPDAQEMVITSLKSQIQDLFSQVNELNNKLVKSYDRVSDLEDDVHVASANLRSSSIRISQLELERTQHLAALNTGLLVEKAHVTAELNRLMEKATEEAAQRGQAESARHDIEKDLDDLSASLFAQANTMVAEARFAQHLSERKVDDAERALKGAEEMVGLMQTQMQEMQAGKEEAEKKMLEMQVVMGRGKWSERVHQQTVDPSRPLKLLSSHVPYQEFLMFVAHIRSLHQTSLNSPAMAALLPLPFLSRLSTEDSEPTVRLDLAPALNWLSRRAVLSAIHGGQLTIEPIPITALFSESTLYSGPTTVAGINLNNDSVSCALCGTIIVSATEHAQHRRRPGPLTNSWSGSFFKRTSMSSISRSPSPASSVTALPISRTSSQNGPSPPQQVFIFRVASSPSTLSSALPISSLAKSLSQGATSSSPPSSQGSPAASSSPNNQPMTIYPLCSSGWCLMRLRTTCTLWSFVRTGIVEKVWEEEIPSVPPPPPPAPSTATTAAPASDTEKAPVPPPPPRKRGIWGIASAIGERAASWGDSEKRNTPPPPPIPPRRDSMQPQRRLPPPPPPREPVPAAATRTMGEGRGTPPPLPKRSEVRKRASVVALDGGEGKDGVAVTPSNPETPTRVVFDAMVPLSPMKNRERPSVSPSEEKEDDKKEEEETKGGEELPTHVGKENEEDNAPSNVPLPESLPASPAAKAAATTVTSTSSPARIGSPAIVAVLNASGTPPPLPRRAAARRPIPTLDSGGSRPTTPSPLEKKPGEAEQTTKAEEPQPVPLLVGEGGEGERSKTPEGVAPSEAVEVDNNVEEEAQDKAVQDKTVETEVDLTKRSTSTPSSSDVEFVDASATTTTHTESGVPVPDIITTATSPELKGNLEEMKDEAIIDEDGVIVVPQDVMRTESPPPSAEDRTGNANANDDDAEDMGGPNSREVYIGDATWEERTWKELVKLKEDMLWARIGGWR